MKGTRRLMVFLAALAVSAVSSVVLSAPNPSYASIITVNVSDDADDGVCDGTHCSLREAIIATNGLAGPDSIEFAVPGAGVHTITLTSNLPAVTEQVTINGTTQPGFTGAPLIEITQVGTAAYVGIHIQAGGTTVRGLALNAFCCGGAGVFIESGSGNVVGGNYIGVRPDGVTPAGSAWGVLVESSGNTVGGAASSDRNVISGNAINVELRDPGGSNLISGNFVGTNATGTGGLGVPGKGLWISSSGNLFDRNVVSGLASLSGPNKVFPTASGNVFANNKIGVQADGVTPLPNDGGWAVVVHGSNNHFVGNTIAHNTCTGCPAGFPIGITIGIVGAVGNAMRGNSIHSHAGPGIETIGNGGILPPTISTVTSTTVTGTACATCTVEVFADDGDEGRTSFGSTVADGAGNWTFKGAVGGPNVTATTTDLAGNTSAFSTPVSSGCGPTCVTGHHESVYATTVNPFNHCSASVVQANDGQDPGEISGTIDCTTAHNGTISGSINQTTKQIDLTLTFASGAVNTATGTMSADGSTGTGTWQCVYPAPCGAPHTWSSGRVASIATEHIVAAAGGTVTTALGDQLIIPAGSLSADTNISIETIPLTPSSPPPTVPVISRAFRGLPNGTTFAPPGATAVIHYTLEDLAGGINPADLRVMVYSSTTGLWHFVGGVVDTVNTTITVQIDHFTDFGVFDCGVADNDSQPGWGWLKDSAAIKELAGRLGPDACDVDDDNSGCVDLKEPNLTPARDPLNPWDYADMWVPSLPASGTPTGGRNGAVTLADASAALPWVGRTKGGPPGPDGRDYDSDVNVNGVTDGAEYDRSAGLTLGLSGPPSGAVTLADISVILAQVGDVC